MPTITPNRLILARQQKGLSAAALGREIGVTSRTIARWESGDTEPLTTNIESLSKTLNVPASFFFAEDLDLIPVEAVSFRALSKMTARQRDSATASSAIAAQLAVWIERRFNLPKVDLPTLEGYEPERAAAVVRQRWELGSGPINNMIHLMEAHGIRVFSLAPEISSVDAFSFQLNRTPYVFLNTLKTGERRRFDAAHELGHLVLHCGSEVPHGRDAEREAQRFAAALLMPRASIIASGLRNPDPTTIIKAKVAWKVAAMALAHRLHEVGLMTEWSYRDACVQLSQLGFRRGEPAGATPPETSQVLAKVFKSLRDQKFPASRVADSLSINVEELNRHVFGLIPIALDGGQIGGPTPERKFRVVSRP